MSANSPCRSHDCSFRQNQTFNTEEEETKKWRKIRFPGLFREKKKHISSITLLFHSISHLVLWIVIHRLVNNIQYLLKTNGCGEIMDHSVDTHNSPRPTTTCPTSDCWSLSIHTRTCHLQWLHVFAVQAWHVKLCFLTDFFHTIQKNVGVDYTHGCLSENS